MLKTFKLHHNNRRTRWFNREEIMDLFTIMAGLKGKTLYSEEKGGGVLWKEHCAITSQILNEKYGNGRTPTDVEGQTILPRGHNKQPFSASSAENFAYAILTGYITIDELNKYWKED